MKRFFSTRIWHWALGLSLVVGLVLWERSSTFGLPSRIEWLSVLAAFLSNLGFTLAHNFRWKRIVDHLLSEKKTDFLLLLRSLVDSYTVGKVVPADLSLLVWRSYALNRLQGIPVSTAVFSVLLDRFLDFVILLFVAVPSFLLIMGKATEMQALYLLLLFLGGQGLIILYEKGKTFHVLMKSYQLFCMRWLWKLPFLRSRKEKGIPWNEEDDHFDFSSVAEIMSWNVGKYLFLSLRFYFTGQALGIHFPWLQSFFYLPLIQLSGALNITPGGVGVIELGTYGALLLMGIPREQVLTFVVGQRVFLVGMSLALFLSVRVFFYFHQGMEKHAKRVWR